MSLRNKIIIAFIICIFIVLTPLLYIMQTQVKTNNMEHFEHQTLQLMTSKANEIGLWLNQRISEIRIMMDFPPIKNLDFENIIPYLSYINSNLEKYDKNPNETFAIGAVDGHGWIEEDFFIDVSKREYFNKLMTSNEEYVISDPVISRSDQMPIFLISYPIINDNEKVGFINGAVSLSRVSNIAYDIDIYNGYSWIMNTDKDIYSIDKKILNKNFIDDNGLDKLVSNFNHRELGSISIYDAKGEKSTVFYSSIPNADKWILCTIISDKDINGQINYIIDFTIKLGGLFIFLGILLAILIAGSIVEPIQVLKNNMTEVSNGNLNSYYISNSNDEISVLGRYFNQMLDNIKKLISKTHTIEEQKRTAELKSLQSQINPHFLYNTLDTIQWKALEDNNMEIASIVNSLSGLFRISLSSGKEFITIDEETKHAKYYLDIQKVRYGEKINYDFNIREDLKHYLIPKLIIQPLIENSIYHGLKLKEESGLIRVTIDKLDDNIIIEVEDNGLGMTQDRLDEIRVNLENSIASEHYGLYNINERLSLAFASKYKIDINSSYGKFTSIKLQIPIVSEGFQCIE